MRVTVAEVPIHRPRMPCSFTITRNVGTMPLVVPDMLSACIRVRTTSNGCTRKPCCQNLPASGVPQVSLCSKYILSEAILAPDHIMARSGIMAFRQKASAVAMGAPVANHQEHLRAFAPEEWRLSRIRKGIQTAWMLSYRSAVVPCHPPLGRTYWPPPAPLCGPWLVETRDSWT